MLEVLLNILSTEDHNYIEQLYYKYHKYLYVVAFNIVKEHENAKDIVQNAFIKIIKYFQRIKRLSDNQQKGYLVYIVRNLAMDYFRNKENEKKVSFNHVEFALFDEKYDLEDLVIQNIEVGSIKRKIKELDEKYSLPLILKYTLEFSYNEIADMLNITVGNARIRCLRGIKMLIEVINNEVDNG